MSSDHGTKVAFPIRRKLLLAFLGLSALSLLIVGTIGIVRLKTMGRFALESSASLGREATDDSGEALRKLGEELIRQKALDVALRIETYLESRPGRDYRSFAREPALSEIAVQPVGKTGYTSVLDSEGINVFHHNPQIVGADMDDLKDKLPDFYALVQRMKTAGPGGGYYRWQDPDGRIREKYLYHARVKGTDWTIGATTYIDEFLQPVEETKEKIAAATADATRRIDRQITATLVVFLGICAVLLAAVLILSISLSGKITRPIRTLTGGAEALGRGDLETRVEVKTGDEIEGLARSFNAMAADLKTYTEDLKRTTAEKERLEKELEIARGIQQSFLPEDVPHLPRIDIAAASLPAREVGGDFYDFIPLGEETWGLAIADVSGKGVPAALFMALSRTLIRATASGSVSPSAGIRRANDLILADSRSNMFVTLFYAVLNGREMTLRYVNAGHNPPLLLRPGEADVVLLRAEGIALGVLENIRLKEEEIRLDFGDVIALYTDGVTEAINEKREQFGQERFARVVAENRSLSAKGIIQKVTDALSAFAGAQPQFDDITLMVLKVTGA